MDNYECRQALEAGRKLEGNGFRVYMEERSLVIQDLIEGWWQAFDTYTVRTTAKRPQPSKGIRGKRAALVACPPIALALGSQLEQLSPEGPVEPGTLALLLLGGNNEHPTEASQLIPTVDVMRRRAFPPCFRERPDDGVLHEFSVVITALAHLGGRAHELDLIDYVGELGYGDSEVREMLRLATWQRNVMCNDRRAAVPSYWLPGIPSSVES